MTCALKQAHRLNATHEHTYVFEYNHIHMYPMKNKYRKKTTDNTEKNQQKTTL